MLENVYYATSGTQSERTKMKHAWLNWLNWEDESSCLWAINYCMKKQIIATFTPNRNTPASQELASLIQTWPSRTITKGSEEPIGRKGLLESEARMRSAYTQWTKRKEQTTHKSYSLWMKRSINRKIHRYAKKQNLSINAAVEHLIDNCIDQAKEMDKIYKKRLKDNELLQQEKLEKLQEIIRTQAAEIAALKAMLANYPQDTPSAEEESINSTSTIEPQNDSPIDDDIALL